ncbi:ribosome maturation factor RimP [Spongisporangium articulatum]|uniref:Ribosome maturation factor RimP n=1 Tax=Spongisporangium articulatum TaxID=3362603 RepID=A0ABW8APX2_9ACTN
MGAPSPVDGVRQLVEPLVAEAGLVLEDVTVTPAGKRRVLRITVDLPETETGGVPMDSVAEAAQAISAALDADASMGSTPYVLEVSSPGADRPLTQRRHWLRARGRLVRLTPADGVKTSAPQWSGDAPAGRLEAVDDDGVELEGGRRYPWGEIRAGKVELDFSRPVEGEELDEEES